MIRNLPPRAILVLLACLCVAMPMHADIPALERQALIALYNSTNGSNWKDKTNWLGVAGTECTWFGISCNESATAVIGILLYDNNLAGPIPADLSNLSRLRGLDMGRNGLTGGIPSGIGNLGNLLSLSLGDNGLSGSIPPALGNLRNLQSLVLANNRLSGEIPSTLGNLTNLFSLYLGSNLLSGSIPGTLENLTALQTLDLASNQLTGSIPSGLGNLAALLSLGLGHNHLAGNIPPSLGNLTNLQYLQLQSNRLGGNLPAELGNLINLIALVVEDNQLTGNIPVELANLATIPFLSISDNALYSNDPIILDFLKSVQPDWAKTQTVAPGNVSAAALSGSSIQVSWSAIAFTGGDGRYEVHLSTASGGPYSPAGTTASKSTSSLTVDGLQPATTYYAAVRTVTEPTTTNQNRVTSDFSVPVAIKTTNSKPSLTLTVSPGGATSAITAGIEDTTRSGYAVANVTSGSPPYATAVFSFRQRGVIVSEAAVPASPPTTAARIFVDYRSGVTEAPERIDAGSIDIDTGIAIVNQGSATANITYRLRSTNGDALAAGSGTVPPAGHFARFISQLNEVAPDFHLPADFPTLTRFGSLEISSDRPVSVLALRLTVNQPGDTLITTTPVADLTRPLNRDSSYFPQFVDGGGYITTLMLLNTSGSPESGRILFYDDGGAPFEVNETRLGRASGFQYSIPPGGVFLLQTDGSPAAAVSGSAHLVPDAGTSSPVGAGVLSFTQGGILVTESGVPAATPTTHARIYIDQSGHHGTGLAIAAPNNSPVTIALQAYRTDGRTAAGTAGPVRLNGNGHAARFVGQLVSDLPEDFIGVLDVSSDSPFAALTLRSLINERGNFLLTTFPIADGTQPAPTPIVFPQIADGGGYRTQFILLSAGGGAAAAVEISTDGSSPSK